MSEDADFMANEDSFNYKSITCDGIPDLFLDKLVAKKYFGKFGKIKRFILRPKRLSCTVEYESESSAEEAIVNAGYFNGQNFMVKYTQNEVAHARNTEEWVDPEVQAELDSMRPQARLNQLGNSKPSVIAKVPKSILKSRSAGTDTLAKIADSGLRSELEAILKKQAFDNEEKFRILDARDKLVRLTTVRTTDIKRAESIKGFCPDMCPEKERLLRENRNQIAIFELEDNSRNRMDHKLAVKEYSRSSADQETPLPHELRPEPVLKLTMTYLMYKIIDLCDTEDVNIADWYNFIWDRTRSIRKDITQQELCSNAAVELVEQCARFHIHCAARLVAEDSLVFDQKINTENLTKCLQTLKYMYHDLRLQNKKCPNEAEFRSYVILLNLNDANFLWEVKQLPEEIQNSTPIRFALATYLAMESNNYVKFFSLIREASYMHSCILLRYFTQVRIRAIRAIMIAYKWPLHVVSIPVSYFSKILAFESDSAARLFFEYHGLDCEGDKVTLDKKAFYIPEMPIAMERALDLVEAKKKCTAGEAVCGKPLDGIQDLERYVPHNSFDENGYLKTESWNAEDQNKSNGAKKKISLDTDGLFKVPTASPPISPRFKSSSPSLKPPPDSSKLNLFQPISKPIPQTNQTLAPAAPVFGTLTSTECLKEKPTGFSLPVFAKPSQDATPKPPVKSIFGGSTTNHVNTSQPPATTFSLFGESKEKILSKPETIKSSLPFGIESERGSEFKDNIFKHFQTSSPTLDIFKRPNKQNDKVIDDQDQNVFKIHINVKPKVETVEQHKREELERIEKHKKEQALHERHQKIQKIDQKSEKCLSELLQKEISLIIEDIGRVELKKYHSFLSSSEKICNGIITEIVRELLTDLITQEVKVAEQNKNILRKYFSLWQSNVQSAVQHRKLMESTPIWISEQFVTEAHPQQAQTLEMMERYLSGHSCQFHIKSPKEQPIDIFKIFLKQFRSKQPSLSSRYLLKSRKYFKFVISLPNEDEELRGFNSFMKSWLKKKIIRRNQEDTKEFFCETHDNVSICLRNISGISQFNELMKKVTDDCDHAHGLIFLMTSANFLNSRKRLHHLLKLSQIHAKIPLAIITYNLLAEEEFVEEQLHIQKLIDDEKISYYSIFPSTVFINKNNLHEAFEETFKFLAQYTDQNDELEMQNLCTFLRSALGDEFWKRLLESARINPSFRKMCTQPDKLVSIYNDAVDLLIQLLEEDYDAYPEFPSELRRFVPQQSLDIPSGVEHFPIDWKDSSRNKRIQYFLKRVKLRNFPAWSPNLAEIEQMILSYASKCISSDQYAKRAGYGAIKHLLESINEPELQELHPVEKFNTISWLPVIQSITLELLTFSWHSNNTSLPQGIIYKKSAFREYLSVPWWFENVTLKSIKMVKKSEEEGEEEEKSNRSISPPSAKRAKTDIDALLERSSSLLAKADRNIALYREITNKSRGISRTLDEKFYQQDLFNRKMKRYIRTKI